MEEESKFYYGQYTFTRSDFYVYEEESLPVGVNPQWEDSEPVEVELKVK